MQVHVLISILHTAHIHAIWNPIQHQQDVFLKKKKTPLSATKSTTLSEPELQILHIEFKRDEIRYRQTD